MAKRIKIGDIFEIPTKKGLAYAQYTHKEEQWGSLIRVLPGFHEKRPESFSALVTQKEQFVTFLPLQGVVSRKIFEVIGNEPVPSHAASFPVFRGPGFIDREGRVQKWYLWDGQRETPIGKDLSEGQKKLPILAVINDTLLIERIEQGWTPETDIQTTRR